jgi:hypothetical protein
MLVMIDQGHDLVPPQRGRWNSRLRGGRDYGAVSCSLDRLVRAPRQHAQRKEKETVLEHENTPSMVKLRLLMGWSPPIRFGLQLTPWRPAVLNDPQASEMMLS